MDKSHRGIHAHGSRTYAVNELSIVAGTEVTASHSD